MANLGMKGGIYHVRFRFRAKEYKKSLKIRHRSEAEAARNLVEITIHRLNTGQVAVPHGVDPGDFILSGGTQLTGPDRSAADSPPRDLPSTKELIERYKASQEHLLAPSYIRSQSLHLRHLVRHFAYSGPRKLDHSISYRVAQEGGDRWPGKG